MAKKKTLYPHADDCWDICKTTSYVPDEEPDFIGNAPNYDKFKGWDTEKVLVWLNID